MTLYRFLGKLFHKKGGDCMKKSNTILKTSIALIIAVCALSATMISFAATAWVNQNSASTATGCQINVRDNNTNKWSAGILNANYENNVTWNNSVSIGDVLYIDAYTCYNGGKLWVYEDDVCVRTVDAGEQEHITLNWTIQANKTKFACSASAYAVNGEQLSVTINAIGDNVPPIVTISKPYVGINYTSDKTLAANCAALNASINLSDSQGVVAYYVSKNSAKPSASDLNWIPITSTTSTTKTYTPDSSGVYYVYAKDAVNNISSYASFEAGLLPEVPKPADAVVKEGENATFIGAPSVATSPFTYQWYRNTINSTSGGTAIAGETRNTYTRTTAEADNNTFYGCEVTNRFGSSRSPNAHLTVYFPHEVGTITGGTINLEQGHLDVSVPFTKQGNTNNYIYQWYKSNSSTANGTRIVGATSNPYVCEPTSNFSQWFYCEVSNVKPDGTVLYTKRTNNVKIVADITRPVIEMVPFNLNQPYVNRNSELNIKFTVTDTGEGYTENGSNLTGADFQIYVGHTLQSAANCVVSLDSSTNELFTYNLKVTNITGNGDLSIKVLENAVADNFGNKSGAAKEFTTNVNVNNSAPTISMQNFLSEINGVYINKDKTIVTRFIIMEDVGMESNEFTASDIDIRVGGTPANTNIIKTVEFERKENQKYSYLVTFGNIEGNGTITVSIPAGRVKDWSNNTNDLTEFTIKLDDNSEVIVDNVAPAISNIATKLGDYAADGTNYDYRNQLSTWHDNWSREDVFVTINATDSNPIDYYAVSKDEENYSKLSNNRDQLTDDLNQDVFYRVYDMAGNYAQASVNIKLDKTNPNYTPVGIYELRDEGADYVYISDQPSNKTLYVKALATSDNGKVKSGIEEESVTNNAPQGGATKNEVQDKLNVNGTDYGTYYTITMYNNSSKSQVIKTMTYDIHTPAEALVDDGYYEVQTTTTDNAGNMVKSPLFPIYINKRADNTIRVTNMNDKGSGLKLLRINVYKGDESDVHLDANGIVIEGEKAIKTIEVPNPYKDYSSTVRLGKGKFYVEAVLYDNVDLFTVYKKVINNEL